MARNPKERLHMRTHPYLAFDAAWFKKHQRSLLFLLNTWPVLHWFRHVLRISPDLPSSTPITCVAPNRFETQPEPGLIRAVIRTHWKYSKRMFFAFRPIWWAMHFWDWLIADRWCPSLSFGFVTLTAYPNPGAGTPPVDGWVRYYESLGDSWTVIHDASSGTSANVTDTQAYACAILNSIIGTGGYWEQIQRGYFGFDTTSIVSGSVVTAETFSLYVTGKINSISETSMHVCYAKPTGNSNLIVSDYSCYDASKSYGTITYASLATSSYNTWTCDATGRAEVVKPGYTWIGTLLNYDFTDTEPPGIPGSCYVQSRFADYTGTTYDPYLTIDYRPGGMINAGPTGVTYHGAATQE